MLVDAGLELLDGNECRRLLATRTLGRVAVSIGALPAVLPVNYQVRGDRILFRTAAGTKLDAALHHAVVAFEVDDADGFSHTGWSVLVVGTAEIAAPDPTVRVRAWAPGERDHLVAIPIELISGRRIRHDHAAPE